MGDQPTRGGAGDRDAPGRTRRTRADSPDAASVTVEQLLARSGAGPSGRRAARRTGEMPQVSADGPRRAAPPPGARAAGPDARPTPGGAGGPAAGPGRRATGPSQPIRQPGAVPAVARPASADWEPDSRPSRRSGPIPPLPGRVAPAEPAPAGRSPQRLPNRPPSARPSVRRRRRLVRVVAVLAAVIGVVVLYHLGLYFYVDQKIDRVDALATDGPEVLAPRCRPARPTWWSAPAFPGRTAPASVATLLVSVSAEGDRAVLVSVPPTALVDTPACRTPDGVLRSPTTEAFAASLLEGGPSCTVRAVQQLSGLRIDHYLGVDLTRLPGMVDALGGVPVCVVPTAATAAAAEPLQPGSLGGLGRGGRAASCSRATAVPDVTGAAVAERAAAAAHLDPALGPVARARSPTRSP